MDLIDIRYWWYQQDGTLYAPPGGQNLAPRQWLRFLKPKAPDAQQLHRAVSEYRRRYPDKPVICSVDGASRHGSAVLLGGGSLPNLPRGTDPDLLRAARGMRPASPTNRGPTMALVNGDRACIVLPDRAGAVVLPLVASTRYRLRRVSMLDGQAGPPESIVTDAAGSATIDVGEDELLWIERE